MMTLEHSTRGYRIRRLASPRRPPHAGVALQMRAPDRLSEDSTGAADQAALADPAIAVRIDGRRLSPRQFEVLRSGARQVWLEILPEAFPWTDRHSRRVVVEVLVGGRRIWSEPVSVDGFQA